MSEEHSTSDRCLLLTRRLLTDGHDHVQNSELENNVDCDNYERDGLTENFRDQHVLEEFLTNRDLHRFTFLGKCVDVVFPNAHRALVLTEALHRPCEKDLVGNLKLLVVGLELVD